MKNNSINILIVHYNTPHLTECLVKSINKFVSYECTIYIFDNSDKDPFTAKFDNVTIFDNTKGQIIDFDGQFARKGVLFMQALEGLKVVEVGNIIAGPWCGSMLADIGATVIKVEPPKGGDLIRNMGRIKEMWYAVEGRNKKNVTLLAMSPLMGTGFQQQILGYSLMSALGIRGDEIHD